MWAIYALCSAFFAALTSILAKIGIEGVNSNLATAVRTVVVVVMAWLVVFMTGSGGQIGDISRKSWLFLVLSGSRPWRGPPRGGACRRRADHVGDLCFDLLGSRPRPSRAGKYLNISYSLPHGENLMRN